MSPQLRKSARRYVALVAALPPVTRAVGDVVRTPAFQDVADYLRALYLEFGRENARREIAAAAQAVPVRSHGGFVYDDGGRAAAGFSGDAGDCVTRAIAIAAQRPYGEVYDAINAAARTERGRLAGRRSAARTGVHKPTTRRFMEALGWTWTPTMAIGSGCRVHLKAEELPGGRLVVQASKHLVAVIDGVIHDTSDPSRGGTRCVYGYWRAP